MWRKLSGLVALGALALTLTVLVAKPASASDEGDEWQFLSLVNQERVANNLAPLGMFAPLRDVARAHSGDMAAQQKLFHRPDLGAATAAVAPDWRRAGENVGHGGTVESLHQAFMNSPPHRANVLGDFNYVGVGEVRDAKGDIWVTFNFLKAPDGKPVLTAPAPPAAVTPPPPPPPPPPVPVERIAGPGRFDTSVAVAKQFPDAKSNSVVVARSDVFADALAGGPLAAAGHGPVLLAAPTGASIDAVVEAHRVLAPGGTVYLLGGTNALSDAVAGQFADLHVVRVAGVDRYDTAVQVARLVNDAPKTVFVVSGTNFADAMVTGPAAAQNDAPIVLAGAGLPDATSNYLASVPAANRIVIGGNVAVSDLAALAAHASERVAGSDRFATSVEVAKRFFADADTLSFADGATFQDALAGAALSAAKDVPLVLLSSDPSLAVRSYVQSVTKSLAGTIVYGTTGLLSDDAVARIWT